MQSKYELLLIPFSIESKDIVKGLNLSLTKPKLTEIEFVVDELKKLLSGNYYFEKHDDSLLQNYFVFYPYARIILSYSNKSAFYSKFSEFYAKMILKEFENKEIRILELLNIDYDLYENDFSINFKDYISAKILKDKDMLVNKPLLNGRVVLTKTEVLDFASRFVAGKVVEGLPLETKGLSKEFNKYALYLQKMFEVKKTKFSIKDKDIDFDCFPPCMAKILSELLSGGKPSHIERYYLATFLFSLKMDLEKVLEIFSHSGDYKENIAKYQLEKIKGYSAPSCNTLKNMGLCVDDNVCGDNKNPIDYYWKCMKRKDKHDKIEDSNKSVKTE
jgi:DNA primase large subunit